MKHALFGVLLAVVVAALTFPGSAIAAEPDVVIGDIDDLSGVYSENGGMGGIS